MFEIVTAIVDEKFDVRQRLMRLSNWKDEWLSEDERLKAVNVKGIVSHPLL